LLRRGARPVAVTVQTAKKDSIAEMSWVKVTGKATFPVEGGQRIPMVVAKEVALCDPPEERSFIDETAARDSPFP
jgi:uncharacterized membrane protein YcgQ (UPF0703/DUF1980 family)